ncbi:MAG: dehydrogenase [Acidobacteriota bacterium]|nr:dehydrogenase [Acidobacteriota bacterium]
MAPASRFEIAFSADFLNESGQTAFPDIGLSILKDQPGVSYRFLKDYRAAYTPDQLSAVDVLISLKPRVAEESLRGVERLTAIGRCGVGYDNVDLAACTARDIAVFITPAGVVRPVAESIVLLVLATSHRLVAKDRMVRAGAWVESTRELGREPRGRAIGTIGLGNIAREAVRLLRNFDVGRFLAFDPWVDRETAASLGVEMVGLEELLRSSDYVLVNCPLTSQTRGMIGERELGWMKPDAVLVNTARGAIVREGPLIEVLASRRIGGAALDVFEQEPLDRESPLMRMDNVILTSHSVCWTEELFRDMGRIDCEGALLVASGEVPPNVANREVLVRPGFLRKLELYRSRKGEVRA